MTAPSPARSPWKRFVWIGLALFVLAAVFLLVFWPQIELRLAINGLSSAEGRVLDDVRRRLRESTDPATDELLADAVADAGKPFLLRERAAQLLLLRNRLPRVEELARSSDLMTRAVALQVLRAQPSFARDYLPAPEYRVEETVRAWLADTRLESRKDAIGLAMQINLSGLMDHVRPLLDRAKAQGAGPGEANYTLTAAVDAAVQYADCASVPAILALAESDAEWAVRGAAIRAVEALAIGRQGGEPLCPDSVPRERLDRFLAGLLATEGQDTFPRSVRMLALGLLERHPALFPPHAPRVREILDGPGNGAERRDALAALVVGKDAHVLATFPRYVHDRDHGVRSTAVEKADEVEGIAPEGLWIGILRDEVQNFEALRNAHHGLKQAAGTPVGLPKSVTDPQLSAEARDAQLNRFLQDQMQQGSSMGVDRDAWATEWFRWLLGKHGWTEPERVDRALAARKGVRAAMDAKDAAKARAALETVKDAPAPLFLYERAWLATQP